MRVVVATLQRGRRAHLVNQARGLRAQTLAPERYVIVSMDPEPAAPPLGSWPADGPALEVVRMPVADGAQLPLATARNRAVAIAEDAGAELVVMLDVDCIPSPRLVERFAAAHRETGGGAILLGPVGRLAADDCPSMGHMDPQEDSHPGAEPATPLDRPLGLDEAALAAARAREPRPAPAGDALARQPRPELFWSLSYALAPATHRHVGGYDEGYVGYGAEDTDFGVAAAQAGVELWSVGGAWAYHQHHPVSSPPREHVADIVRNANRFHARWGWWPMDGWLRAFAAEGLVDWRAEAGVLELRVPAETERNPATRRWGSYAPPEPGSRSLPEVPPPLATPRVG